VLLVVAAATQKLAPFSSAIERLEFAGGHLLGIVLNQSEEPSEDGGYDYYREYGPVQDSPRESPTLTT
jgi:Mrp family chromosome partitioning ATPase